MTVPCSLPIVRYTVKPHAIRRDFMRCAQPVVRRGHCARRRVSERNRRTAAALSAEIDTRPTLLPVKGLFLQPEHPIGVFLPDGTQSVGHGLFESTSVTYYNVYIKRNEILLEKYLVLSECDKKDTLFFYSFGFRILDTSVTCRFLFFIQPFDFLLLLLNFNFLKFMYH